VQLEQVEILEGFHLEAVAGVNHHQHKIGNFGQVSHGVQIQRAFEQGNPALATSNNCDGPHSVGHVLSRIYLH
jgi:hypothetical protein